MDLVKAAEFNKRNEINIQALRAVGWWHFRGDPFTEAGVMEIAEWQQRHGLTPDGAIGPASWREVRRICQPAWKPIAHGIKAQIARFGDPRPLATRAAWAKANLVKVQFWDDVRQQYRTVHNVHREIADEFKFLIERAIKASRYSPASIQVWNVRKMRGGTNTASADWSKHSWAVAFDFDPQLNGWGNKPAAPMVQHPIFVAVFRIAGWSCGYDWGNPDTMHVQGVTG
jgi:hypothetical protein